ncbi:xylulokinase [Variovorax sp. MHTC-1]|uniref:xylulokinase n=1 Tax=Variovorax sp. MHTC-1 TaxID=2495593 RepID=UPI000F8816B7|nr:xylulokinase [Variovorax sp. MHTC-1]RST56346.1 xylulokinase [Variovorax sp. MHTC-1]
MYLGLDLGTSELKALLLADDHRIVALARAPLSVSRPAPLWSEQSPSQWWEALEAVMTELQRHHGAALSAVRAIGLSGQMHGAVAMDAQGRVLRPAILWNDGRSAAQCDALAARVPCLAAIAGNLAMPGFTAPKLLWMREHEPALFARIACVLLPKDWLRFGLSGERASDMSDASGTLWLDVAARDWSDELLAACGLTRAQMPRLVEGSAAAGRLRPELAQRWGLKAGVPIAGGGGDNAASAVGMGLVDAGQGFVSLGTSGVIFVCGERFEPRPEAAVHAFCHALPGRWHQMSVMLSASSAISWAARSFGLGNEAALLAAAATLDAEARRRAPLFLPYLSGERSPHNDADAQGVLFGLTHAHGPADVAYAVAEGVSFGLRDGLDTLTPPGGDLVLVGGGARSAWWAQLLADILDRPLAICEGSEAGGALGAARLAWLADGGTQTKVCLRPAVRQRFEPARAETHVHGARHARFKALYAGLRACFADDRSTPENG